MKTWNIGNTTVRNPARLREALSLFVSKMSGRPFSQDEQQEFLNHMVSAGLVNSDRKVEGDDGGRKFGSAFKQLGFVTDWAKGKPWQVTDVGKNLIAHPEIEESIFLRQLLKYQISSPLEQTGTQGFRVRPFRLLLRFLKRAHDEQLIGLTKFEIGLYVITGLTESDADFQMAFANIKTFRQGYDAKSGKVAKNKFAYEKMAEVAASIKLRPSSLLDYADSNSRYSLMSGLLTLKGNKLAVAEARLPYIEEILGDGTTLVPNDLYLNFLYNAQSPHLPTDNQEFLTTETAQLLTTVKGVSIEIKEPYALPPITADMTLLELQAYEQKLRNELIRLREIKFYRNQKTPEALAEILDLIEDIRDNNLVGGQFYAPAFFEWAIWRLFLAINDLDGPVNLTRGFRVDEDIRPLHHAKGGAADLDFTYANFKLVCEMTLATGSRQFVMEGEPVTRHVFKAIEKSAERPVYGLFISRKLDPNTADAFHNARYWKDKNTPIPTPVIALEINQVLELVHRIQQHPVTIDSLKNLLDLILVAQSSYDTGPAWFDAYSKIYSEWLASK